jgi:TolA-binding protein
MRQNNRSGAKDAYEHALEAYADEADARKTDPDPWLKQAYALALLGRVDDAHALLEKTAKRFPDNRNVRTFIEAKQLDRILAEPSFKDIALSR